MEKQAISVNASSKYDIFVGYDLLKESGKLISAITKATRAVIVTDDVVAPLYAEKVMASLSNSNIDSMLFTFPNGEKSKSHDVLIQLYEYLAENQITRSDIIIALGGGVVGDLTGFAAATYLRGIDFIQIPTTLLAQTDSSIGGKTAVNISNGKNLVGAFKQPSLVICDLDTLKTLSKEIYADGISEIVKYGAIRDNALFDILNIGDISEHLEEVISTCIKIKRDIVEADEFDKGERMLLNFGHTLGHSLEKHYNFTGISHGKAVAIGMCIISHFTEKAGITKAGTTEMLVACLEKYGLETSTEVPIESLIKDCLSDKKRESSSINIIACNEIGKSEILKLSIKDFYKLLEVEYV